MIRHTSIAKTCLLLGLGFSLGLSPLVAHADDNRKLEILSVDDTAFPKLRLYVEVPNKAWAEGAVKLEFRSRGEKYDAIVQAIADAKEKAGDSEEANAGIPAAPVHDATATGVPFAKQDDPKEAMLVTFLLDNSGSMEEKRPVKKIGKKRPKKIISRLLAINMVEQIIKRKIRSQDTIVLAQFAAEVEKIFGPNTPSEAGGAVKALKTKYLKAKVRANRTHIFQSFETALDEWVQKGKIPTPTLPNRRVVVVISDGGDSSGAPGLTPFQVANKFKNQTQEGVVVTVGIGTAGNAREAVYDDLADLAGLVDVRKNHSREGTVADVLKTYDGATKNLYRQVMVDLEVPKYHWQKGEHEIVLNVTGPAKEGQDAAPTKSLQYNLKLASMSPEQVKEGEARQKELLDFLSSTKKKEKEEESAEEKKDAWKLYGIIGGSVLFLLILIIIIMSKKRQAREQARRAREGAIRLEMETSREEDKQKILDQMETDKKETAERAAADRKSAEAAAQAAAEAARTVLATLTGADGPLKGRVFPIKDPKCLVGRDDEHCQLAFPNDDGDLSISRVHAQLIFQAGGWAVVCMSDGGMAVNQASLRKDEQYPVQFGDLLTLGKSVFRFGAP
jgi:hypothetical protein